MFSYGSARPIRSRIWAASLWARRLRPGDAGFGGWVAGPGSFFGAGIFYCQVAGEKIPGLRQIPMEWWEETKPAPVDRSNAGDVVVDWLCSVVPTLRLLLIRLTQQTPTGSVGACPGRRSRKPCGSSRASSRRRKLAERI